MSTRSLPRPLATRRPRLLRRMLNALLMHRERQNLLGLDAHMLADIGLTADQARAEAARSVWDAPPSWRQR